MNGKVLLYSSNDIKIGETFIRRARQLVKQQRAVWIDGNQNAIRFFPGMENMDIAVSASAEEGLIPISPNNATFDDGSRSSSLIARLRARKWFIIHSISLIPGLVFLMIFSAVISETVIEFAWDYFYIYIHNAITVFIIFCSIWMIAYLGHAYLYVADRHARKRLEMRLPAGGTVRKSKCGY